jgi:hypothetical protein
MKAIETRYNGYRFRSRLEARWAVFFDAAGIPYEYEPEGFFVGGWSEKTPYLPDFRLCNQNLWVEVKGDVENIDWQMMADAVDWGNGLPGVAWSSGSTNGLLILGNIPYIQTNAYSPFHPILQHDKGGWVNHAFFVPGGIEVFETNSAYFDSFNIDSTCGLAMEVRKHFWSTQLDDRCLDMTVFRAYLAARSARFEHGEKPVFAKTKIPKIVTDAYPQNESMYDYMKKLIETTRSKKN